MAGWHHRLEDLSLSDLWELVMDIHLMGRADSFEKTLMLGKIEGRRRRGQQRMRWLDGITDSIDMSLSEQASVAGLSWRVSGR